MNRKNENINTKLKQFGRMLGLDEATSLKSKRTTKNILAMAIAAGAFFILGSLLSRGGLVGQYYAGASVRDFQLIFRGFF